MRTKIAYLGHVMVFTLGISAIGLLCVYYSFRSDPLGLHGWLINLCMSFDVFRALFYSTIATWIVCLAVPFLIIPARSGWPLLKKISVLIAFCVGFIPPVVVFFCRKGVPFHIASLLPSLLIGINGAALIALRAKRSVNEKWLSLPFRFLGVDILFPVLVQENYRQRERRFVPFLFPVQALFFCLATCFPWVADPKILWLTEVRRHPSVTQFIEGESYQVEVDASDGNPIIIQYPNLLRKADARSGQVVAEFKIDPNYDGVQGFALNAKRNEIAYVEPCHGKTFLLAAKDLSLLRAVGIEKPRRSNCFKPVANTNRTQWDPDGGVLLAFTFGDFIQVNAEGDKVVSENPLKGKIKPVVDVAIDSSHGVFHQITWDGRLMAMDIRTQKPREEYALASVPERIVRSGKYNRLFISLPVIGAIEAVEIEPYRRKALIPSFPGVRSLALDEERGLLFAGGFAPYLEIRSLTDFRLIDRIATSTWQRWVTADPEGKFLYISNPQGVLKVAREELGKDILGRKRRVSDPFFSIVNVIQRWIHDRLGLSKKIVP